MAFVIADLTDAQLAILVQREIPHTVIPDGLVARFRAILPEQTTAADALIRLVKLAILDSESRAFANNAGQQLDQNVRAKRLELKLELGL